MVTGCFDLLHSGHVAFLREASQWGALFVCIGSDENVFRLKGRYPVCPAAERKFLLENLACVEQVLVNQGFGILDFLAEIDALQPDVFFVNEDGHSPEKEALCREREIVYKVARRQPVDGLPGRSTTALRAMTNDMPYRLDLAGGWLDQPWVSKHFPGPVITISLEPTHAFNDRSGMATSTRKKAVELWGNRLPEQQPEHLARLLFAFENPPGTNEVAGSQDSIGIVFPAANKSNYAGRYWPENIENFHDEQAMGWLERHLHLLPLGPRAGDYAVLSDTRITPAGAKVLAEAAEDCWRALRDQDLKRFGDAMRRSFEAQVAMFPHMADASIYGLIGKYADQAWGWKLSGAGGGGYLVLVSEQEVEGALKIRIRRKG